MKLSNINKKRIYLFLYLFLFLIVASSALYAQKHTNERAEWFIDARFGMFIHWGIYSGAEGIWKGEQIRHNNEYAEWIYYRNNIDKKEYLNLLERINWDEVDPEEWVVLAKKAGMKYITLTAKHHDGFALWDSKVSNYNITNHTTDKRDIVKELAKACRKHGIKLGLYYSHWVDWEHPYGWDHSREIYPISAKEYDQYWQEKVIPQMQELLTNYGDIDLMWFDMWLHHSESIITKKQLIQLKELIRELQPNCLVNSRLGLSIEEDSDVDFRTLADNQLGDKKLNYPWQSPATVAHSWGYHRNDTDWKSTTFLLKSLISNVSLNGNYMLNIGPRANGNVPHEISQRLKDMGKWLSINGASIYGSGAFDLPKDQHDWGNITYKVTDEGVHQLFLHIYNWPLSNTLPITGINCKPQKVYMLNDKQKRVLPYKHNKVFTKINLPGYQFNNYVSVVVMEFDSKPEITEKLIAKNSDGGYSFTSHNTALKKGSFIDKEAQKYGTIPAHTKIKDRYKSQWKIYIDDPGEYALDISYSYQAKNPGGKIKVKLDNKTIKEYISPTGLTVGEPNENWHIDRFNASQIGTINFTKPGIYKISLQINAKEEPVKFQWLWLEKRKTRL
ncbi:alpha-L-fucosidase [Marinilabiliaceae bacterium ANBcel2]|nr:alpha-L-fucosidase [Marinilabiliaceae bacterium ANBcel2]